MRIDAFVFKARDYVAVMISQFVKLVSSKYTPLNSLHLLFILSNPVGGRAGDDHPGLPLSLVFREVVPHLAVAGGHDDHGEEVGEEEEDDVEDIVQH